MSSFDSLNDTFDITPTEPEAKPVKVKAEIVASTKDEQAKDYNYARGQLYNIVEKMQESLDGAMEVAQQSDHPRAYEVVFAGAKHAAEAIWSSKQAVGSTRAVAAAPGCSTSSCRSAD